MPVRRTSARRPTMKDIAQRAGVSESAVSFALNDRPGVSEVTRDRVRRVAEQLGWRPSTAARQLSGEGSATVGLVLARPADTLGVDSFFLQLISGIQEGLAGRHLGLLFQVVEDVADECEVYRRWWAERRVDGVLVVDPRTDDPRPALLAELGLPAVIIGGVPERGRSGEEAPGRGEFGEEQPVREGPGKEGPGRGDSGKMGPGEERPGLEGPGLEGPDLSTVWADDAGAMAAVVDRLYALGHRHIVHIAGLPGLAHTERRIRTLRAEAERRGLAGVRSLTTDYSDTEGAAAVRSVLRSPDPPTALVCDNDVMAVAGVAAASALGFSVPADVSIVAWEDSALCRMVHPWLSALTRDTLAFGRTAATELLSLLDGAPARTVQVPVPRLIERESTGPAKGSA
ncbi:LacI family DNA-binding transcriptional regulator [Streptomyces sp. 8L]|uniref:LacI family DNA-binding transcriptional regulator n=1 Tax=Streptomyces sp. 8L TaxID=2877242 RepID=UPI001CD699E0|nr:LacI family DNA-binding transcriptional regulator [Streptomyces sp. 8L]MCA1220062.1 LacI family transcriptional regulator [Streptomyces sp. 8L]